MAIYQSLFGHVELPETDVYRPREPSEVRVDRRPAKRRRQPWEA
jgi:hypothetical protein